VSYLLRNGETRQFSIPSLPLGIAYGTEPETVSFRLRAGDLFIAVSDGVAEEEADGIWLSEWLSDRADTLGGSARDIAERIMGAVESRTSEKVRRDDMTVAVVRISER
jgi:serine phosphatase RsbU (regulator of sigma subunit)